MEFVIQSPLTPACRNAALRRAGTIGSQKEISLCDLSGSAVKLSLKQTVIFPFALIF
jgi:hypothetical protein